MIPQLLEKPGKTVAASRAPLETETIKLPRPNAKRSLAQELEASPRYFLLLFTAVYLLAEVCSNWRREFWFDELFTYQLSSLPSIKQIWPLIQQGIELNPPLPFWITWIIHHTLGRGELLTRLPSIAGFWAMCVCLFYYVRRRSDAAHGFIALLIPLFTYTASEGTWARGYGLLLGFSAASLLLWQLATDGVRRRLVLPALAISLAAAISCHYYALYVIGALWIGESVRAWSQKRIDFAVFLAIGVGVSPLAAYVPLLRAVAAGSKAFWVPPLVQFLYESYADLFGPAAMVLLLLLIRALRIPPDPEDRNWTPRTLGAHEVAACAVLAAMPLTIFVAAQFTHVAFFWRYVQPVVIGFSVAVSMFAYRIGGGNRRFRNVTISLLVWLCFLPWALWHVLQINAPEPWIGIQARFHLFDKPSSLPLVIDQPNDFLIVYHYAPPEIRGKLYFLYDAVASTQYLGTDTGQRSLRLGQTFHDFHVVPYDDFVHQQHEFLVARTEPSGWLLQELLAAGADVRLLRVGKERREFVEDRLLFHVAVR